MALKLMVASLLVAFLCTWEVSAHGRLIEPVSRSSAWRKGFDTPRNYDDNQLFCGGFAVQFYKNNGKCGPCGDDYSRPQPRDNENGGKYGSGAIVRQYKPGQKINVTVEITANHMGYFEFSVCPLNSSLELETEECFAARPLYLGDGTLRHPVPAGKLGYFDLTAVLPDDLVCEHCVLRWHYFCGNNWGFCGDGTGRLGCGPQETFRGCADVAIL